MLTQYDRLLRTPPRIRDAALLAGLKSPSPSALEEFLRRCNESRSLEEQIPAPPAGAGYLDCDPRLLAHLYARTGNLPALQALAQRSTTDIPTTPSYSHLSDPLLRRLWELAEDGNALRELLRRRDRRAEIELLRLYNKNRKSRVAEPPPNAGYEGYPRVLLALLWVLVGNVDALRALGGQLLLAIPEPPLHEQMTDDLLLQLWRLGRDGSALKTLWLRQGVLPVARVNSQTPEAVLGFLVWHEQRGDARDELLRRYMLLDATREEFLQRFKRRRTPWPYESVDDFAQDVTVNLLQQVESWDYLHYPRLENRLFRSVRNMIIDLIRKKANRPLASDFTEIDLLPDTNEPAGAPADLADQLPPLAHRVVLKAKQGLDLTPMELDWSADQNLGLRGVIQPTADQVAAEGERILTWLRNHVDPTGEQLVECFLWHDPCKFDRGLRNWRLRQGVDGTRALIDRLLPYVDEEGQQLAIRVLDAMTALTKRCTGGKRRGRSLGTVPLFATLQAAGQQLWHHFGRLSLNWQEMDAFSTGRQTFASFGEEFPILLKLAACWRLVRSLIGASPTAAVCLLGRLASWLENGQWLSTFPERDRQRCQGLRQDLEANREDFPADARSALELLLLWLDSIQETGVPEARLVDLDRAWWLSQGMPLADHLVTLAFRNDWVQVSELASQMLQNRSDAGRMIWSAERERSDCLQRLFKSNSGTLVKLASCRRLVDYLKDNASAADADPLARVGNLLEKGQWQATMEQVQRLTLANGHFPNGMLSALHMLGLWLRSLPEAGLPGQTMQDIDRVWSLSHEPDYQGPDGLPILVDALVAAAWQGNWTEVARTAGKIACKCPEGAIGAWSAQHEFRKCLQRLASKRERRR